MQYQPVTDRFGRVWMRNGTALEVDGISFDFGRMLTDAEVEVRAAEIVPGDWVEPKAPEQIVSELKNAVQAHLDATARADDWDSIYTASLRASFDGPYRAQGIRYAQWMDACWQRCHEIEASVMAGQRSVPTPEQLIAELPALDR